MNPLEPSSYGTGGFTVNDMDITIQRNPGWHDTILKDMDGDGDIDMVTKVWNADEGTDGNPDRKWHLSYWRNDGKI